MAHEVTLIPGDGTGPELIDATRRVLEATGVEFEWDEHPAGEGDKRRARKVAGCGLPQRAGANVNCRILPGVPQSFAGSPFSSRCTVIVATPAARAAARSAAVPSTLALA